MTSWREIFRLPRNADEWRNFGVWITERLRVKVEWAIYLIDLRLGFRSNKNGKWSSYFAIGGPVTQNFHNAIFTLNIYIVKTTIRKIPFVFPRINLVFRPLRNWWFETGIGILFDRGEFAFKIVIMHWPDASGDAEGWNEGNV